MFRNFIIDLFSSDVNLRQLRLCHDLDWAPIYRDSLNDKEWIANLPLNVGRWAGNYAFSYILNRVLSEFRPKEILQLGLSESSKVISAYIDNYLTESNHTIVEQDINWNKSFCDRFSLSDRSSVNILPLVIKIVNGYEYFGYKKIEEFVTKKYDLYVVGGPIGNPNYTRYDIVDIVSNLDKNDEFLILLDDFDETKEKHALEELKRTLVEKNMKIYIGFYKGLSEVAIIGTKQYQLISSLL